jgi:hypothetical protein
MASQADERLLDEDYWDEAQLALRASQTIARVCPELAKLLPEPIMAVVLKLMMSCVAEGRTDTLRQFSVEAELEQRNTSAKWADFRADIMRRRREGFK